MDNKENIVDFKNLGKRIRQERRRNKLTQEELAESIGMTKAVFGSVERGERTITVERLVRVANRLGVTVDYLLSDSITDENSRVMDQINGILYRQPITRKYMAVNVLREMFKYFKENEN